ncbi:multidrug resistance-associated protein 1-like isoform X2 [Mytilus californianus]|uniref:multidrug resistance-associated protein 1-like isoform X2 n=1 Tax=Mytilus californianus TaxID=6549 RepID=UPI002247DCA9|nr:multidrug resistance-associated protein 1-like isoform X2 [Mytilus californianus]
MTMESETGFCDSPFLALNETWNTVDPDFSPCFQKTVILWIPCAILVLGTPIRIFQLSKSQVPALPFTWLNIGKTILSILIALLAVANIGKSIHELATGDLVPTVDFVSPLILCLCMILTVLVIHHERRRGVFSSGFLLFFWLLLFIAGIFTFQSLVRAAVKDGVSDVFRFVIFFLYFPLLVVQLVFSALVDGGDTIYQVSQNENPCPEERASFLSRLIFWWFNPMVIQGYKRDIKRENLWALNHEDNTSSVFPRFEKFWKKEEERVEKKKQRPETPDTNGIEMKTRTEDGQLYTEVEVKDGAKKSPQKKLLICFIKVFGPICLLHAFYKLLFDILQFISPLILRLLIRFTKDKGEYEWRGYLYSVLMFLVAVVQSLILHQYFHGAQLVGMRLRTSIIAAVYNKMLKLSSSARRTSTVGEIVNLMAVDAQRFMDLMTYFHTIWSGPFQIAMSLYFLWQTLGPSILAGFGVMVLLIPINAVIAKKSRDLQMKQMGLKDKRIKLMNEVLNGIKVLKLYAWEPSFEKQILDIRNKELVVLRRMAYLNAVVSFTWTTAPFLVSLVTFAVYVMIDPANVLDADKAFVSLSLFNILRFPLSMLPQVISMLVQASVSLKRIQTFLNNDELDYSAFSRDINAKHAITIEKGIFSWEKESTATLKELSIEIPDGSLVAVVGQVGCGKSSLLSAILGEMDTISGKVNVKGSMAYVAQQAWIQNTTLQNNILFGKDLNQSEYDKVVDGTALRPDLEILPGGDQTEIGEKGINLSGGQKQRVSLARAVYQDADVYLLDDPLSAVDSHVGKHIFDEVLGPNGLLRNKTRILVTHGISFLSKVDIIITLVDGKISEMGSYSDLISHAGAFAEFLKNYLNEELEKEDLEDEIEDLQIAEDMVNKLENVMDDSQTKLLKHRLETDIERQVSVLSQRTRTESEMSDGQKSDILGTSWKGSQGLINQKMAPKKQKSVIAADTENLKLKKQVKEKKKEEKLIQAEGVETGKVKLNVFMAYLRSVGILLSLLIIFFYILYNAASIYSNIWLAEWSNDNTTIVNGTIDTAQRDLRLGIYGVIGFIQGIFIVISSIMLYVGNVMAGQRLHAGMLQNTMKVPIAFYDTTPLGRIMNRFSKDIDVLDTVIPRVAESWLACLLRVVSVPLIIGYTTPWFLAVLFPLTVLYIMVQRFYVATSRQLKRLESVSRSPIYSHFGETITGVTTIRAYQQQLRFIAESEERVDENNICYFPSVIANRWLAIRLEFVGNCIVFFACLFAVIGRDTLTAGIVGLSISYALNVTQTLNWLVRMTTELETNIVAVERVKEYTETPTEAAWEIEDKKPALSWPDKGSVEFNDYGVRYREGLDLVLKGISCKIDPTEKIGIVGRTGAGKSSLTLALFRILEKSQGNIIIDGIDISTIGLHDLRAKITIIPQDPVLFSGSLRMNIDPFSSYTDDDLWKALEHAHLKTFVSNLPEGLQHECSEGGENLSVGQRQLVCLARALLRKTKILVLDEATAAVDLETDDLIQNTIRTEFSDCTILTIAHRLNTIMDYTRVMVLDAGVIKEFDSPNNLLKDTNSLFFGMAKNAGLVA